MNLSDLVHRSARNSNSNTTFKDTLAADAKSPTSPFSSRIATMSSGNRDNTSNDYSHGNNIFQQLNADTAATGSPSSETNTLTNLVKQSQQQPFPFSMTNTEWINDGVLFNNNILHNNGNSEPSMEETSETTHTNSSSDLIPGFSMLKTANNSNKPISSINDILTNTIVSPIKAAQVAATRGRSGAEATDASSKQQTPVYLSSYLEPHNSSSQQQQHFQNTFFYNFKYQDGQERPSLSPPIHSSQYTIDNSTFMRIPSTDSMKNDYSSKEFSELTCVDASVPAARIVTPDSGSSESNNNAAGESISPLLSSTQIQSSPVQPQSQRLSLTDTLSASNTTNIQNRATVETSSPPNSAIASLLNVINSSSNSSSNNNNNNINNNVNNPEATSSKPKITGENVTADNIVDGYIQFVLSHDPTYISDGIDSLVYAKRKFQSVPKTGDISYTTWDIFQLVRKLHHQEIKNWSQLVGQLGLQDMAGRPQFAQRVKRWMHKYKIDCYFDYLLGNEYEFNPADDKYSHCLLIGNYKRKGTHSASTAAAATAPSDQTHPVLEEEDMVEDTDADAASPQQRMPILMAGSRKRMRDNSHLFENARKFVKTSHAEDEETDFETEDNEQEKDADNDDNSTSMETERDDSSHKLLEKDEETDVDMDSAAEEDNSKEGHNDDDDAEEEEEEEEEELVDEIDELASSSSSPTLPIITSLPSYKLIPNKIPKDTKETTSISTPAVKRNPVDHYTQTEQALISPLQYVPPLSTCLNCNNSAKETNRLKAYVAQLEAQIERQNKQISKLLLLQDRTEKWRKQIISDLARGPAIIGTDNDSSEDCYGDEDDDYDEEGSGNMTTTTNSGGL